MSIIKIFWIEHEHERQQGRSVLVTHPLPADLQRVGAGDGIRSVRRKPDRRGDVGHQAKIKHEHVHGNQRHRDVVLRREFDHHWGHQGGDHDVTCRGRQAGAEYEADQTRKHQHDDEIPGRQEFDNLRHDEADAGQRHGADDNAGGRGGNAYRRHIACSGLKTRQELAEAEAQLCRKPTLAPEGLPEANACGFAFCLRRPPVATLANGMG